MGVKFLSDEWFAKVQELTDDAGEIEIPDPLKALTVNLSIATDDGEVQAFLKNLIFKKGHDAEAPATIKLSAALAKQLFIDGDQSAGMQAFMSGEMQVEGDMTKLMELQTVQPSDEMRDLAEEIQGATDF